MPVQLHLCQLAQVLQFIRSAVAATVLGKKSWYANFDLEADLKFII